MILHNLDDPGQAAIYIPYTEDESDDDGAYVAAYRAAWAKCSSQLSIEIDTLYQPIVASVVRNVTTAYEDILPGLPYSELPVVAIQNATALFVDRVVDHLPDGAIASHLYPADAPNIAVGMKNLISGFVDSNNTRYSTYDITRLRTWYTSNTEFAHLLAILHDFEQFDTDVIEDIFHICSICIPELPVTFILFLASPPFPSFIHAAYPRSTLSRLRLQSLTVPTGSPVLEHILLKTFFNPSFDPDLMLGPAALATVIDHYTRHNPTIDSLLTSLQLMHLKHFLVEPLSILSHPPSTLTTNPAYAHILSLLGSRLSSSPESAPSALLADLAQNYTIQQTYTRNLRLGFTLLCTLHTFLTSKSYNPRWAGLTNVMINTLRGHAGRDVKGLGLYVKKLRRSDVLQELLKAVHEVYESLPSGLRRAQEDARTRLSLFRSMDPEEVDSEEVGEWLIEYLSDLLQPLERTELWDIWYTGSSPFPAELLNPSIRASLISGLLRPYDFTLPLPLPPSQGTNQQQRQLSPTVSDLQAQLELLPLPSQNNQPAEDGKNPELHTLPDTSILFARYLDSSKLINIYDWYETFKAVIDVQREERIKARALRNAKRKGKGKGRGKKSRPSSPTKTPKRRSKQKPVDDVDEVPTDGIEELPLGDEDEEPDEESYQRQVQARFIRALHELDYLGFIKHTGRRVEHVARTIFDVGDGGGDEVDSGE